MSQVCRCGGHRIIRLPGGDWVALETATAEQLAVARASGSWPGEGAIGWACSGEGCTCDGVVKEPHAAASKLDMLHQIEYGYDANHSPLLDAFARDTRYQPRPLTPRERLRRRRRVVWERIGDTWRVLRHGLPEHDEW